MPRNIVILLDGTSNEITRKRSNVLRLYGTLSKTPGQIVYYDPGVGTFGADNAWSNAWRRLHEFWGMITGWGLDQNVKEAYRFLAETYDDGKRSDGPDEEPDRIYIFGFSRGAYSARVLAGFIHAVGLLNPVNMNLLDYAYRAYKSVGEGGSVEDNLDGKAFAEVRLFERILRSPRPVIRCLGLFDTVASVIEWRRFRPTLKSHVFTRNNASVQAVRHALAIDERRTMFQPQLWGERREYWGGPFRPPTPEAQDVNEVWFTGVHGDIGGGYPEDRSALAKIPLEWMIDETRALGLQYSTRTINLLVRGRGKDSKYVAPDALAMPNDSMTGGWRLLEYVPRRLPRGGGMAGLLGFYLPLGRRRVMPAGARIHASVEARRGGPSDVAQPNIPPDREVV